MLRWTCSSLWLLLLHLLQGASGESQLICSPQSITAVAGGDVVLPCRLEPPVSASGRTVEWSRPGLDPAYVHVQQDGRLVFQSQHPRYKYSTAMFLDQLIHGNVSLKIFGVKLSEAGKYGCFLPWLWKESSVQLTVDEDAPADDAFTVSSSSGCTAFITFSVLLGLILTASLVFLVWKWRRDRSKREEEQTTQRNDIAERQRLMDEQKERAKLSEELQKKEEEQKDLTQIIDQLKEETTELMMQRDQLRHQLMEAEREAEENETRVKSVEEEVEKTENRAQGYLKLREIITENNWKLEERKREHQQLSMNIEKIIKRTCGEIRRSEEKKNEAEKIVEQLKQRLQEIQTET